MVGAITLVMLAIAALFAFGIFAVVFLLRFLDKLFPEKEKGTEPEDESGGKSRR